MRLGGQVRGDDLVSQVLTFAAETNENRPIESEVHFVQSDDRLGQGMEPIAKLIDQLQLVVGEQIVLVQDADLHDGLDDGLQEFVRLLLVCIGTSEFVNVVHDSATGLIDEDLRHGLRRQLTEQTNQSHTQINSST